MAYKSWSRSSRSCLYAAAIPAAGDLGAIDAKYDIAVSTSCAALDYIVVDNTGTAQCCVELLRRQGLGVATFLILDKQQHLASALQTKPTPPEGDTYHPPVFQAPGLYNVADVVQTCAIVDFLRL